MNKRLKFNDANQKVFVGSDFHINHNKPFVYKSRGFENIKQHDDWIMADINSLVRPQDILIFLGDSLAVAIKQEPFIDFWSKINCKNVIYIFGNHEQVSFDYYRSKLKEKFGKDFNAEVYPFKINNLMFIGNYAEVEIAEEPYILSHYAFRIWNKSHYGAVCLSGHSHGTNLKALPHDKEARILDCGVDVAKNYWEHSIFSYEMIKEIMQYKNVNVVDHHSLKELE